MDEGRPRPFHERFDIEVGLDEAKRRFINRAFLLVFNEIERRLNWHSTYGLALSTVYERVAFAFGVDDYTSAGLRQFIAAKTLDEQFERCLYQLEIAFQVLIEVPDYHVSAPEVSARITQVIRASEVDLGIEWRPPIFVRTGARLLDERLVDDSLHWLRDQEYMTVLAPFEKGLSHYLEAANKPERLGDVITDMYETTEALVKVVTGKDRDLSKNRELFIKSLQLSDYYKRLLKDYIQYGSEFRHAERLGKPRPPLSEPEVESFIYLTGLFIRLVMRTT